MKPDRKPTPVQDENPDPADLVPTSDKRAAQPSEAEHLRSLKEDRKKVAGAGVIGPEDAGPNLSEIA